jgi:hypothetical protein
MSGRKTDKFALTAAHSSECGGLDLIRFVAHGYDLVVLLRSLSL